MRKSLELRQERGTLWEKAKPLLEKLRAGTITADERTQYDALTAEIDAKLVDIQRFERAEAIEAELAVPSDRPNPGILREISGPQIAAAARNYRGAFRGHVRGEKHPLEMLSGEDREIVNALHARWEEAFRRAALQKATNEDLELLKGVHAELRDMGFGTGSEGGYLVPTGFVYDLEIAMKWYGGMLQASGFIDTATGNNLPWPTMNDTAQVGELIGENTQVTKQDLTIGQLTFYAWKYSTKMIPISMELMQDSAFALEGVVKDAFAIRLGRILNTHFTTGSGSGSSQPNGVITAVVANNGTAHTWGSSSGPGVPLIAAGAATNDGGAEDGTASIGSQDLVNLEHSLDKAYRQGAAYMAHDLTWRYLKTLLDKYGRPLFQPGIADRAPDTIGGYPFFTNNDMATLATGNKTLLFGQLAKYKIRRVRQLEVLTLRERFADYGQIALIGFARYDGNLLDAGTRPVNYLKQA